MGNLQISNVALAYFELTQGLQVLIFNFAVWANDCTVDCLSETLVFHLGALLFLQVVQRGYFGRGSH